MTKESKRNYWLLSGTLFFFFLTWSFTFSFFPIWAKQIIGLSGGQLGWIFTANAIAALCLQPLYGFLQDKLGLKKHLLYFVGAMLILVGPFTIYVYAPLLQSNYVLGVILGAIVFSLAFMPGVGAVETYIERVSRVTGFEFGKARMWGSLGWAAATKIVGELINIDPNLNFWAAAICAIVFVVLVFLVRPANSPEQEEALDHKAESLKITDALHLFKMKTFWAFATFVMGVSCIYSVYDQQFPVYFTSLFSTQEMGNKMYGNLNALQVFLEAGGMFLAPFVVNKIGAKNGLILSGIIMATRMIGSGMVDSSVGISAMKLMHAAELPIMLVAIFKYISATFDARLSATIYLVGFQFITQALASVLSVVAGYMYDAIGFSKSYIILGSIVSFFVVISHFILTCDKRPVASTGLDEDDSAPEASKI